MPEIVKIEPLQWRPQAEMLEPAGIYGRPPVRRAPHRASGAADESTHGTIRSEFPTCARCALKTLDRLDIATDRPEYRARLGRVPPRQGTVPRQSEDFARLECGHRQSQQILPARFLPIA